LWSLAFAGENQTVLLVRFNLFSYYDLARVLKKVVGEEWPGEWLWKWCRWCGGGDMCVEVTLNTVAS